MKIKGLIVLTGVVAIMLGSCSKNSVSNAKLKTKEDSLSYAFGIVNFNALQTDSLKLDPRIVAKAMLDGEKGKPEIEPVHFFLLRSRILYRQSVFRYSVP